jgi:hypothetical protein
LVTLDGLVPATSSNVLPDADRAAAAIQDVSDLTVARHKMLIDLPVVHSSIWMTQMP